MELVGSSAVIHRDGRRRDVERSFEGKVVVVTGAGAGIGRATAQAFAEQGARLLVADIDAKAAEETVLRIGQSEDRASFARCDVTREADAEMLVKTAVERYGRLDCAVNNAGIEGEQALTADCSTENWERVLSVNLTGVFLGMKHQIPQMLAQGGGAIVNVASTMAVVAHQSVPAYIASKHGVLGLTRATSLGYLREGIRVNAVCPGNTKTRMLEDFEVNDPAGYQALLDATPIGRLAEPTEIAEAILWLCSGASSYCGGLALLVDGGYTVQ
jgi:NAD(P)-dependent dehydrogenase (short-subunit alcohol dehydrogenase family)